MPKCMPAVWLLSALLLCGCGQSTPDGSCLTDFDCEADQLCGLEGLCLLCSNCQRGVVGTCTAPVFPGNQEPDVIILQPTMSGDTLLYRYSCPAGDSEFRYPRLSGERCFKTEPDVRDPCGIQD